MSFSFFRKKEKRTLGFTLVEMMVTLSIFAVITGVVLAKYKDFNGGIVLTNLAYEIAITIRQSQVYGLSVKDAGSSQFNVRYGVHLVYPTNNTFSLFADADGNQVYTGSSEIVSTLSTTQGNMLYDFCGVLISGVSECARTDPAMTWLDITFLRPNPDALFRSSKGATYQSATITVRSPSTGRIKTVTVRATGQISVN